MLFNRAADNSKSSDRRSRKGFTPRKLDDKGDKLHVLLSLYCKQVAGLCIKAALLSLIYTSVPNTGKIYMALRSTQLLKSLTPCLAPLQTATTVTGRLVRWAFAASSTRSRPRRSWWQHFEICAFVQPFPQSLSDLWNNKMPQMVQELNVERCVEVA